MAGELALIDPLWVYFDPGPVAIAAGVGFLIGGSLPFVLAAIVAMKGGLARPNRWHQLLLILWLFFLQPGLSATNGLMAGFTFAMAQQLHALVERARPQIQAFANRALDELRAYFDSPGGQVAAASVESGTTASALVEGFRQDHPTPDSADGDRTTLWQRGGLMLVDRFRGELLDMAVGDALADRPPGAGPPRGAQFTRALDAAAARLLNADVLIRTFHRVIRSEANRIYRSTLWLWLLIVVATVLEIGGSRLLGLRGLSPRPGPAA